MGITRSQSPVIQPITRITTHHEHSLFSMSKRWILSSSPPGRIRRPIITPGEGPVRHQTINQIRHINSTAKINQITHLGPRQNTIINSINHPNSMPADRHPDRNTIKPRACSTDTTARHPIETSCSTTPRRGDSNIDSTPPGISPSIPSRRPTRRTGPRYPRPLKR